MSCTKPSTLRIEDASVLCDLEKAVMLEGEYGSDHAAIDIQ